MPRVSEHDWDPAPEQEAWNEPEAVRLLREAGALVAGLEATGARAAQRELYHARLVATHEARDMPAYRIALNGYVEAAREAYRKAKREKSRSQAP